MNFFRHYRNEIIAGLVTCATSTFLYICTSLKFPNDDQFILYRYIDNIAGGKGFVYNVGEHVLGATTPLFTLVASLVKIILPNVSTPTIVASTNIFFLSLAAVFFYRIARYFLSDTFSFL